MSAFVIWVGQRLRQYRVKQHLTQEKLAEMAGLHPTYIGQVERGEKNLTIESLYRISVALEVPLSQIFEQVPVMTSEDSAAHKCMNLLMEQDEETQNALLKLLEMVLSIQKNRR